MTNIRKIFAQQPDTSDIFNFSLVQLMNMQIKGNYSDSSSSKFMPYTIKTISKDEILASGSQDLMEVLRRVAGIDFCSDVVGQVGISVGGIWANEGKVILMIDGKIMNEFMYGTLQFGNHYPVENIRKIEIIKGAGSVLIGSFGELMVINVITDSPDDFQGIKAGSKLAINQNKRLFYQNYFMEYGKNFSKNLSIYAFARYSRSHRSDKQYYDVYNNSYNLWQNQLNNLSLNYKIRYKKFEISGIYDDYQTTTRDYLVKILSRPYQKNFKYYTTNFSYSYKITPKLLASIKIMYQYSRPWESPEKNPNPVDSQYYSLIQDIHTLNPKIFFSYSITPEIKITSGGEFIGNYAIDFSPGENNIFWNGQKQCLLTTFAQFGEIYYQKDDLVLTGGERLEYNPIYGFTLVPRLAIVRQYSHNVTFKLSYDRAFRPPTVANITYNYPLFLSGRYPLIKPELSNFVNSQISLCLKHTELSIHGFYLSSHNTISYFVSKDGTEGYANVARLGSYGLYIEAKYLNKKLDFKANLSLQQALEYDSLKIYYSPGATTYLGTSWFKSFMNIKYKISENIILNNDLLVIGPKMGYYRYNSSTNQLLYKKFPWTFIISPSLMIKNKNLNFNIGIYNLLNSNDYIIQAYEAWHAPLFGPGRLFRFSLSYKF